MKEQDRKVVVVGLDGATFDVIGRWTGEGKLPNLERIMKNGVTGRFSSSIPPVTPVAWASIMTGKNPGKHGVFDFDTRQKGSYHRSVVNASNIDGETLWSTLSKAGLRVGVVHVPLTHPPEKVNGFVVSGYALSPSISTYPPNLVNELFSKVPRYKRIYSDILLVNYVPEMDDDYIKSILLATEEEKNVTFYLMENYEWDFFMTHFYFGDQIQHFLWKYMDPKHPAFDPEGSQKYGDAILTYYEKIDDIIGQILRKINVNTTMIVLSDHGMGPLYKRVYINHWLRELGLLKLKESGPSENRHWLCKLGFSREKLLNLIEKHNFPKFLMKIVPRSIARIFYWAAPIAHYTLDDIDYPRTKAYSAGYMGQIFINLKGRDPEGIVPEEEYEELRTYITKKLYELTDPDDGEKIVDKVFRREEIFRGPHVDQAPDMLFIMRNMAYITQSQISSGSLWEFGPDLNSLTSPPGYLTAWHRMDGILIATGRDIKKEVTIENAKIIDLVPTILHIFDLPIPSDIDGRVLKEIFKPESRLAKKKIRYRVSETYKREKYSLTNKEEEELKRKLKALGYLG